MKHDLIADILTDLIIASLVLLLFLSMFPPETLDMVFQILSFPLLARDTT